MKKWKKQLLYVVQMIFAFLTVYIIIYAFYHRDQDELVYIIFNSYALLAVILGFVLVLVRNLMTKKRQELTRKRLRFLTQNLSYPAMLWNDSFTEVVLNDALSALAEIKMREDFNAKYVIPPFFGKKELTDEDIREIVLAKNKEYSFTSQSGTPHDVIWNTATVETDDDGVTWMLSVGIDYAELHNMQSELETYSKRLNVSEGKHNLIMELMDVGILMIEHGNMTVFPSEKLQQMWGLSGNAVHASEIRKRVYPLDVVQFDHFMQTLNNRMRDYLNRTDIVELRICSADGQYRWYCYRFKATENTATGRLIVGGSVVDITDEKVKDARIEQIAYEDTVTGIPNRSKLMQMGRDLYQCTIELSSSYWVIVMDIDRFHLINDTCGYAAGNELLRSFAEAMMKQQSFGGFGARISGDNFALILRDTGDDTLPENVVKRIQRVLATKAVGVLANRALTCSAGCAKMPADGESFEKVLEHAEFALSSGGSAPGHVIRYTSSMHDSIIQESMLEARLREAIGRNELVLYYQPKVSLETGAVVGLEALIRWQHPSGKLILPDQFIPVAEKSMLITQITKYVLDEACRQAKLWQTMGLAGIVMSINFSSTDFYQENICEQIQKTLQKHSLDPRFLEIELTETLALKDIDVTVDRMQELRRAGIQLAMDDFGTGYSSLSYLQRLPFTMLKLDRAFVMHMEEDAVVQEIIYSVARIAKAKQIQTIAEGVETPSQARMLRSAGCDYVQGYLYGKPMNAKDTEQFLRTNMKEKIVY